MALTIIPFLFSKFICFQPNQGSIAELNSVETTEKQLPIILQTDFPCLKNFI
jgi:hypothetical protein